MPQHEHESETSTYFPAKTDGLVDAGRTEMLELADAEAVDLRIAPVAKQIGDTTLRMLAYYGSVPGPALRVREGSELLSST